MSQPISSPSSSVPPASVDRIILALRRIMHAADVHSSRLNHLFRVTGPQITCLNILVEEGPMTQSFLAQRVSLGLSTVNGIIDRLEGKDLVTRKRDTSDRRRVILSVTDAGKEMVAMAPSPLPNQLGNALRDLPRQEQESIAHAFERVMELMEQDTSASRVGPDPSLLQSN